MRLMSCRLVSFSLTLFHSLFLSLVLSAAAAAADLLVSDGQKIAFLGDSITQHGWEKPTGYVNEVISGLASAGVKVTPIAAGVSGNKSNDMLARVQRDVIAKKPDWMTLSCGVNDVWHGERGVNLEDYKKNITAILDACKTAGIKVLMLTATPIGEKLDAPANLKLAGYNDFLRAVAKERDLPVADLNADMQVAITAKTKDSPPLTTDGVHMANAGNMVMARGVLRALGLSEAQLAAAGQGWLDTPNIPVAQTAKLNITLRQYTAIERVAAADGKSVDEWLGAQLTKDLEKVIGAVPVK